MKKRELKAQIQELKDQIVVLEGMRPIWAQGYSSDSVAAQVSFSSLTRLWDLLRVSNQTDAVRAIERLMK